MNTAPRSIASVVVLAMACGGSTRTLPPEAEFGAACTDSSSCEGGLSCIDDDRFPDGYCSLVCADGVCPDGSRCVDRYGAPLCLADCTADSDCRDGYHCWRDSCVPLCASDADCGDMAGCVAGRCSGVECVSALDCGPAEACLAGRCVVAPDAGAPMPDGAPCTLSIQCVSGICLPPEMGGVCASECADRDECDFDHACAPVPIDVDGDGADDTVVAACVVADPAGRFLAGFCTTGTECESRACVMRQCAEVCNDDGDCLPGMVCRTVAHPDVTDASYRGCWYEDRTGVRVDDVDLGMLGVTSGLETRRVSLGVPNDALSVTLMARRAGGEDPPLSFFNVWDSRNVNIFELSDLIAWNDQTIRWTAVLSGRTHEQITMLVPNTGRYSFVGGRYGFTAGAVPEMMGDVRSASVALTARVKRGPRTLATGTLDLNVFLVGVGLTAAQARTDARLQNALAELDTILGTAGISVGAVGYVAVTGALATRLSIIDSAGSPTDEMAVAFRLSADQTNDAINVFLVRRIDAGSADGGFALGIAGGIPGPPGVHGTMHSGILVTFDAAVVGSGITGSRNIAQIMAHEIGHYLGLYHVREQLVPCPAGTGPTMASPCAPFGGEDVIDDTSRSDRGNLMYWRVTSPLNTRLTDGQDFVLLRNPLVQ